MRGAGMESRLHIPSEKDPRIFFSRVLLDLRRKRGRGLWLIVQAGREMLAFCRPAFDTRRRRHAR